MKKVKVTSEILHFGSPEYADIFMKAVEMTSRKTMITNTTILRKSDYEIEILDTRSFFLIEVGQQYQVLKDENLQKTIQNSFSNIKK